jgi:drug/metabolite transporter (DMT)-like permease
MQSPRSPGASGEAHPRAAAVLVVLFGGVFATASASIMIRLAQQLGMPSTTIAAGRLLLAALILLPIMLWRARAEVRALSGREVLLGLVSGVFLAIHFVAWISSLEYTSVASSVALVSTNPLWVGLLGVLVLRERLAPLMLLGILLTFGGSLLIGLSDSSGAHASNALLGDGLALLGALAASVYFLIGRELRRRLSTMTYIWLVYSSAAVVLLGIALVRGWGAAPAPAGQPVVAGYPPVAYLLLLGLALGPQLLGHTAFNWALRYLSATFVAVAILGEPIGSALLALLLFQEGFAPWQFAGFVLLLSGIVVAARAERMAAPEALAVQQSAGM